jgi:heat shock protein HslJ
MAAAGSRLALLAFACAACTSIAADARTFDGTRWQVTAINGRSTPRTGYFVSFSATRISARFGCNAIGGDYRIAGNLLIANDLASTLMGCPEPAATLEQAGMRVLDYPAKIVWHGDGRIALRGDGGAIELERAP